MIFKLEIDVIRLLIVNESVICLFSWQCFPWSFNSMHLPILAIKTVNQIQINYFYSHGLKWRDKEF